MSGSIEEVMAARWWPTVNVGESTASDVLADDVMHAFRSVPGEQAVSIAETVERLALAVSGDDRPECVRYCVLALDHDEDCMTAEDIAEEQLRSRDYESWARL